jgi:hypothetical protein
MKILSNYKDYYDYVEYLNSPEGGDPKIRYIRTKLGDRQESGYGEEWVSMEMSIPPLPRILLKGFDIRWGYKDSDKFPWVCKWCVVCGKFYLLVADSTTLEPNFPSGYKNFKLVTVDHPIWEHTVCWEKSGLKSNRYEKDLIKKRFLGAACESAIALSKAVGTPVFTVARGCNRMVGGEWKSGYAIDRIIPNLGYLGFASVLPAERLYQEMSLFVGNVLRESPDTNPPAKVSDKERLVQRGFDLKSSFRGKSN